MLTAQPSASTIVALFNLPLIPNYDFLIEDSRHCFERAAARKLNADANLKITLLHLDLDLAAPALLQRNRQQDACTRALYMIFL